MSSYLLRMIKHIKFIIIIRTWVCVIKSLAVTSTDKYNLILLRLTLSQFRSTNIHYLVHQFIIRGRVYTISAISFHIIKHMLINGIISSHLLHVLTKSIVFVIIVLRHIIWIKLIIRIIIELLRVRLTIRIVNFIDILSHLHKGMRFINTILLLMTSKTTFFYI